MSRSQARLNALERQAKREGIFHVWHQAENGADVFTCELVPGVTLTGAQLAVYPIPPGTRRIVVHRETKAPTYR